MLPDCLSAEGEQRCRQLLTRATAQLRARPAAAAVLVPLCSVRGVPALLYTLRSSRLVGRHKGEVRMSLQAEAESATRVPLPGDWEGSLEARPRAGYGEILVPEPWKRSGFPGGKCDPTDQDVVHTALRETHEELGLAVPEDHVWGILHPIYDQAKNTVVPVLAGVGPMDPQSLKPNPEEVDEVFALPLAHLLQVQNQGYTHFCRGGHFSYTMPVFLHGPHRVWGMTAVITEFTLQLLAPGAYQSRLDSPWMLAQGLKTWP